MRVLSIDEIEPLAELLSGSPLAPPDARRLAGLGADTHRVVVDSAGTPLGRCAIWWRKTPRHTGHRVGLIGHYATVDAHAAQTLLASACEELERRGCSLAIGPMDGNTWGQYRFITWHGDAPHFALEPWNPLDWPRQFEHAGFDQLATYTSAVTRDPLEVDPRVSRAQDRFRRHGVLIRDLHPDQPGDELRRIHQVASVAFRRSFLFTPVPRSQFLADQRLLWDAVDPRLVFLAEHGGRSVGFLFALPDFEQRARGERVDTVVLKTVAALPEAAYVGLAACLVGLTNTRARHLGYARVIHALMHDANPSLRISGKYAAPMRRYALFAKQLGGPS